MEGFEAIEWGHSKLKKLTEFLFIFSYMFAPLSQQQLINSVPTVNDLDLFEDLQPDTKRNMDLTVLNHQAWRLRLDDDIGKKYLNELMDIARDFKKTFSEKDLQGESLLINSFGNENLYNNNTLLGDTLGIFNIIKKLLISSLRTNKFILIPIP